MNQDADLSTYDLKQLWNILKNDKNAFVKGDVQGVYNQAKYGVKLDFHIEKFLQNMITEKPKSNLIKIGNKRYNYEQVFDELEERQRLLYELILLNTEDGAVYGGKEL